MTFKDDYIDVENEDKHFNKTSDVSLQPRLERHLNDINRTSATSIGHQQCYTRNLEIRSRELHVALQFFCWMMDHSCF